MKRWKFNIDGVMSLSQAEWVHIDDAKRMKSELANLRAENAHLKRALSLVEAAREVERKNLFNL